MPITWTSAAAKRGRSLIMALALTALGAAAMPAAGSAAISTFGSPLSLPATLDTASDLGYLGTYTQVPPNPEAPSGVFHTPHFGADTVLWNTTVAGGAAAAPASGQAVKVSLEGCAVQAPGGPRPLTQVHFQDLSPLAGGGARVNITSQEFNVPVCGEGGAGPSTVTSYEPTNLCVSAGDYVGFNDEGGYVPNVYRAGVGYKVIGSSAGATMDSFIRNEGTRNGATLAANDSTPNDGFASNAGEELMLQATLGTGPDARYVCPGGTKDAPPTLAPLHIRPQTDGVNHSQNVSVAIYCRPSSGCSGAATLGLAGQAASYSSIRFALPGNRTSHLTMHISAKLMKLIRRRHGVTALVTATMGGHTYSENVTVKIL